MGCSLYIMTTLDEYELPMAVADSIVELASMVGTDPWNIRSTMWRERNYGKRSRYKRIDYDEDIPGVNNKRRGKRSNE